MEEYTRAEKIKMTFYIIVCIAYAFIMLYFVGTARRIITIPISISLLTIPLVFVLIKSKRKIDDEKNTVNYKTIQNKSKKKHAYFINIIMIISFTTGLIYWGFFGIIFMATKYAYYGKLILCTCSLLLSVVITLLCRIKYTKNKISIIIMLMILITPIASEINRSFSVQEVKSISVEITKKEIRSGRNGDKYYCIYVDKSSIPTVNNKFSRGYKIYEPHAKETKLPLKYMKGLLGLQFVEIDLK